MYNEDAPITRYLLIKLSALLDSNHADKHDDMHYWFFEFSKMSQNSAGKKQLIYTIEHILPQNLTPQWKTMLKGDADLPDSDIEKIQSECLHIIGNLTLTANNGVLRDLPFQQKQKASKGTYKVYDDNGQLSNDTNYKVGYQDNTPLNNMSFDFDKTSTSLANISLWNKKSITNRTETMVNILTKYLSLE
jgi:hypothetical protein